MAWIAIDYDGTMVDDFDQPIQGAVEALTELAGQGHRLTIFTSRIKPLPDPMRHKLAQQVLEEAVALGFPNTMEIWEGSTKPPADIFIDNSAVNFDGDWGLAVAQAVTMLQDRGLMPLQPPPDPTGEEPTP